MTVPAVLDDPRAVAPPAPIATQLRRGAWRTVLALGAWTVVVVAAWWIARGDRVTWKVRAAPLTGSFDVNVTLGTLVVLGIGLAAARVLPAWCLRVSWRRLLVGVSLAALAWGLALSVTRGPGAVDRGLASRHEYPAVVDQVDAVGVGAFIDTFTEDQALRTYPVHIQGHPLGAALLFFGLDQAGLRGPAGAAVFILALSSTAVAAVLVAAREVAGVERARRAAPFLVLLPGLVWWVTSADALYATVGAWGTALLVLATGPDRSTRQRALVAIGAGLIWGLGVHLSYGLVPLVLVGVTVAVTRRCWTALSWAALGGAGVVLAFTGAGFWWVDGLAATKVRYDAGVAHDRPGWYFGTLGNLAAFSLAVGPAAWVAFARVRDRGLALLAVPALIAVLVADVSGLSKAEVERIWLPFAPWILLLAGGLVDRPPAPGEPRAPRSRTLSPGWPALASGLLAAQVVLAVAVETFVKTPW